MGSIIRDDDDLIKEWCIWDDHKIRGTDPGYRDGAYPEIPSLGTRDGLTGSGPSLYPGTVSRDPMAPSEGRRGSRRRLMTSSAP